MHQMFKKAPNEIKNELKWLTYVWNSQKLN